MSEEEVRSVVEAYERLRARAVELVRREYPAISLREYAAQGDFDPVDDEAVCLQLIEGDAALLFVQNGYDGPYAASVEFDARVLWDNGALEELRARYAKREAERQERWAREADERQRQEYERLRAKFGQA